MSFLWRTLRWAYSDTVPAVLFMLSFGLVVIFLMTLIAYPVETVTWILLGTAGWVLFSFFSSL